jgi:glycolate dehydrogenase FAD-binding subunit
MIAAYSPSNVDECSDVLGRSNERITFVGGGTELGLGAPAVVDAVVRTERMTRIPDYAPADMVITAEAGVTLAQLQATAREQRQMLALDSPLPERATIGGLVATGAYGPRRARYGAIRDLIIGVTMVRADGAVARGGGKVVKNVAGFDLPKVACGSLGTLGMIANATFRLHPLPEAEATVRFDALTPEGVFALVKSARDAQLEPTSAVAISGYSLAFRFEGFAKGVEQQTERMLALGRGERDDGSFWARHDAIRSGGSLRVRIASLPSRIVDVHNAVAPILGAMRNASFAWYATLGLGFVSGDVDDVDGASRAIIAARRSFSVIVEKASSELRVDVWGPVPNSFPIMEQLKLRFDPQRRLNPGRLVGGL